ncbi:BTAD domain-containing putative transcriptional regulator [Longispora sp. K20-0274]|uniref:AfsR/SARP family transcriptional regulator n=1 Tax=Longispora sp. K20-0274 TaxID=3088255 RepID=UPI003999CF7B
MLDFRVLGPVGAWAGEELSRDLRPRQRAVLAYLLLSAGRVVSAERMIIALWGDAAPNTARAQLQASVSAVRAMLRAAGAADLLATRNAGYLLTPAPGQLDLAEFTRLVAETPLEPEPAARQLRAALDLWRGVAFADVTSPFADAARRRCEDRRLGALERFAELELALGRHEELVGELATAVEDSPLRERLRAHLMLALYRSGRQSDALRVAREYRELLVDREGLDPGREFSDLERAIRRDATPGSSPTSPSVPVEVGPPPPDADPVRAVPAQLPRDIVAFTGRAAELAELDALVGDEPGAVVISTIAGSGGVGKTALAVHWGHRVRDRFPDGQFYVNLHGYSTVPPVRPIDALAGLLRALGVEAGRIPTGLDEATALYRTLSADRRMLVVLDNANSPDQVRPLMPAGAGSLAVITSRDRLAGLAVVDGARLLSLAVLSPAEAVALLGRIIGARRILAEPEAAAELARLCGYLPLGLRLAAAYLAEQPQRRIADHAAELAQGDRIGTLEVAGDAQASVRAVFDLSYHRLTAGERRLFRLLGLVPGPDFTAADASELAGPDPAGVAGLLDRLVGAYLVSEQTPGRYAFHDLLRAYATFRSDTDDSAGDRAAATTRLFDRYLAMADAATTRKLFPSAMRLPVPEAVRAMAGDGFADNGDAAGWLDAERANLVAAVQHAAQHGPHPTSWLLSDTLRDYFRSRQHLVGWLAAAEAAVTAADAHAGTLEQATCEHNLAMALDHAHSKELAEIHYGAALDLAHRAGWARGVAAISNSLALMLLEIGRMREATGYLTAALDGYRRIGARDGIALSLGVLSSVYRKAGPLARAYDYEAESLTVFEELCHEGRTVFARHGLARTCLGLGSFPEAVRHASVAMALARGLGDEEEEQDILLTTAAIHLERGRHAEARADADAALTLALSRRDEISTPAALTVHGRLELDTGRPGPAADRYEHALTLARRLDYPSITIDALIGLSAARSVADRHVEAVNLAEEAVALAARAQEWVREGVARTTLATAWLSAGDPERAAGHARSALDRHRDTGHRPGEARALGVLGSAVTGAEGLRLRTESGRLFVALGMPVAGDGT